MTKLLPDHTTKTSALNYERVPAVKEICLQYGIPSERIIFLLGKRNAVAELEARPAHERKRILGNLALGCERVTDSLAKMGHVDKTRIRRATGADLGRISSDLGLLRDYAEMLQKDDKKRARLNPDRLLVEELAQAWLVAGKKHPTAYQLASSATAFAGEFYGFVRAVMQAANQKPPHGNTIKSVLKKYK
jgi:hypothetical protein